MSEIVFISFYLFGGTYGQRANPGIIFMSSFYGYRTLCQFMDDILSRVDQGPVSRKSVELFRTEKPVVRLQSACSEKPMFLTLEQLGLRSLMA